MVKITRVYTRKGDNGFTRTSAKTKLAKDSSIVRLLGLLDEFNSVIGWSRGQTKTYLDIDNRLAEVQNTLFDIGAYVTKASEESKSEKAITLMSHISLFVSLFEHDMDQWNHLLPTLDSFILPGGPEAAARLHIARTVCRRAECECVEVNQTRDIALILPYMNRLSDWLFVAARFISMIENGGEQLWKPLS